MQQPNKEGYAMNGNRYFLDTNAIIALLRGNYFIETKLSSAQWVGTSAICIIEFLSFTNLSHSDRKLLLILANRIEVINIPNDLSHLEMLAAFKTESKLNLPDALIAGSSIHHNAILISNDKHFQNVKNLPLLNFE
jgi:tRNA(fMet)-specific endonuclease VapC